MGASPRAVDSTDFVTHFIEQDSWTTLLLVGVPAVAFMGLLTAVVALTKRGLQGQVKQFLVVVASSLAVFAVGLTLYEAAALYFHFLPHGSGLERQDASGDTFVFWAKTLVLTFYVVVLVVTAGLGALRLTGWRWVLAAIAAVAVFMVLTVPLVDFVNECNIGVPVVAWSTQRC